MFIICTIILYYVHTTEKRCELKSAQKCAGMCENRAGSTYHFGCLDSQVPDTQPIQLLIHKNFCYVFNIQVHC